MKKNHIKFLICLQCKSSLELFEEQKSENDVVEEGILQCSNCKSNYDIIRYIPRFVPLKNYASGFGLQWSMHVKTQYDSYIGANISEKRFFEETKWPRNLSGETVLEVGSGAGRFTEQAASTGATVVSMDYSYAVDANFSINGNKDNVLIVQADLYNMPFHENFFDKLFCFGVLQHTPNVRKSFMALLPHLKHDGHLAIDVYAKHKGIKQLLKTKYWLRPFTKKKDPEKLFRITNKYIDIHYGYNGIEGRGTK